jgi:hypothetical protein
MLFRPLSSIFLFLLSLTTEAIEQCSSKVEPVKPVQLVWTSLPAGGLGPDGLFEVIKLEFIVDSGGRTSNIEILEATSKVMLRAAKKTIAKTDFNAPIVKCKKHMVLTYELE